MIEPPFHDDDTQPTAPHLRPTTPRRLQRRGILPTWALLLLMLTTLITLIGTLSLLFQPEPESIVLAPDNTALTVTLIVGGEYRTLKTHAATVGDLLREQTVTVGTNDAISLPLDTPITDDMTITVARARSVTLIIDGTSQTIATPLTNPAEILASQTIELREIDRIWLDGTPVTLADLAGWAVPVNEISVQRAVLVTIVDGEQEIQLATTAATVGDALFAANISLYLTDIVQPDVSTPLLTDTRIIIDRARPVSISVDDTVIETRIQGETVADALAESGIALVGLDYVIPAESEPLTPDMNIQIVRVTEEIMSYEETISYESVIQADSGLELDQRRILQVGQAGIQRYDERVRFENGLEIAREPAGSEMVQVPQNEIIGYGTQIVLRSIDTPEGAREYWRTLRVYTTSYKPEAVGGSTTTAIGMHLEHGVIGADPTIIPYRTRMYVPGYGIGIMADTGGARSSRYWIDLGYSDEDWVSWHQYVTIYLLTPVPENINYLLPAWSPMRGLPDNG